MLRIRKAIVGGLIVSSACGRQLSLPESAATATVVDAAGAKLTGAALAGWLMAADSVPGSAAASVLISHWIDEALLATAVQDGTPLEDSVIVDAVITPSAIRGANDFYLAARAAHQPPPTEEQIDSLVQDDQVRVFQQLMLRIPAGSDSNQIAVIAQHGKELVQRLQTGADFTALVRRASQDSATRAKGGFLPADRRSNLPLGPMTDFLWGLRPGQISQLMSLWPQGFVIIRRATPAESRPALATWLAAQLPKDANDRFVDSVVRVRNVTLEPKAARRLRALATEPVSVADTVPLATWVGGRLSPATARMWLFTIDPAARAAVKNGAGWETAAFIRSVAQREILFSLAAPDGGALTPAARKALVPTYRRLLDSVRTILRRYGGRRPPEAAASAVIDTMVAGRKSLQPLPGILAGELRTRYHVAVDTVAIHALLIPIARMWRLRHQADAGGALAGFDSAGGPP